MDVHHERARALQASAGAGLEGDRVRISRKLVDHALAVAPSKFTLHSRESEPVMPVGGTSVFFGTGSETPYLLDQSSHDKWVKAGSLRLGEKAPRRVDHLLESHRAEDLAADVLGEIDAIIAARVAEGS